MIMILCTDNTIKNLDISKPFIIGISDYSKVSRSIYPEVTDDNQYKIYFKYDTLFATGYTLAQFANKQQSDSAVKKLYEIINSNVNVIDMTTILKDK